MAKKIIVILLVLVLTLAWVIPTQAEDVFLPKVFQSYDLKPIFMGLFLWEGDTDSGARMLIIGYMLQHCHQPTLNWVQYDGPLFFRDKLIGGGGISITLDSEYEPCVSEDWSPWFEQQLVISQLFYDRSYVVWVDGWCIVPTIPCQYPLSEELK
jgi:hypothetical protein